MKRFIARRGCPREIWSDNGGAFVANETKKFVAERNIQWSFSLAKAPWYGGIWERLVQSVKRCLKKVVGSATLKYTEIQTVLLEVEAILNSRPLCTLFDDDFEDPLSPNHLSFGRRLNLTNLDSHDTDVNYNIRSRRAVHIENVVQKFWERLRREYVCNISS